MAKEPEGGAAAKPDSPAIIGQLERLKASVGWRYASRPNSDLLGLVRGDAYGFQSEYFLIDGRFTWTLNDALEASLGVDNLTNDQAYVSHPLPQRTAFAEFKMNF